MCPTGPGPPDAGALPGGGRVLVAASGGPDSNCLLHMLAVQRPARGLLALHVDHRLDSESASRARQAAQFAASLGVECRIIEVEVEPESGGGPEAAARRARYRAFEQCMADNDTLVTAHHADDQVETVLLRLLRGSGSAALGGMRPTRRFGPGWLHRPLLGWRRDQLLDYLREHRLPAAQDPANRDLNLDRNYLRRVVMPRIERRWPGYREAVLQSARLAAGAGDAADRQARIDFETLSADAGISAETTPAAQPWTELDDFRALEVLRYWVHREELRAPPARRLEEFLRQCRQAGAGQVPQLDTPALTLRRYNNRLWLDRKPAPPQSWTAPWQPPAPLELPDGLGQLRLEGAGQPLPPGRWEACSRRPGEKIRLPGRTGHHPVGELMRTAGIPPWRRASWPRLRIDGRLVAVGDSWLDEDFANHLHAAGGRLVWDCRQSSQ